MRSRASRLQYIHNIICTSRLASLSLVSPLPLSDKRARERKSSSRCNLSLCLGLFLATATGKPTATPMHCTRCTRVHCEHVGWPCTSTSALALALALTLAVLLRYRGIHNATHDGVNVIYSISFFSLPPRLAYQQERLRSECVVSASISCCFARILRSPNLLSIFRSLSLAAPAPAPTALFSHTH